MAGIQSIRQNPIKSKANEPVSLSGRAAYFIAMLDSKPAGSLDPVSVSAFNKAFLHGLGKLEGKNKAEG